MVTYSMLERQHPVNMASADTGSHKQGFGKVLQKKVTRTKGKVLVCVLCPLCGKHIDDMYVRPLLQQSCHVP